MSKRRKASSLRQRSTAPAPASPAPAPPPSMNMGTQVSLGANAEVKQVAMIFGDPTAPNPMFVTFTPQQAREIGAGLHVYADKAEGKLPS